MGKGGCLDLFGFGVRTIRAVMGCICCLLCTGPILIVVGIVLLLAPNNFKKNVQSYEDACNAFAAGDQAVVEHSNATLRTIGGGTAMLLPTSMLITFNGVNADKVKQFTTTYLEAAGVQFQYSSAPSFIQTSSPNVSSPLSMNSPVASGVQGQSRQSAFSKPSSSCNSYPSSSKSGCRRSDFDSHCAGKFGSGASWDDGAGSCVWYQQEKYFCFPMRGGSLGWSVVASSCDYIDGDSTAMGTYSESPTVDGFGYQPLYIRSSPISSSGINPSAPLPADRNFRVQLRSPNDPYITASRLTKGTMDWGVTATQQRATGAALIGIGSGVVALMCTVAYFAMRRTRSDPRNQAAVYGAFGRTYQPSGGYQQMPPGTYGGVAYGPSGPVQYNAYAQPQTGYQAMPVQGQPYQQQTGYGAYPPPQQNCSPAPGPQSPGYGAYPPPQQNPGYPAGGYAQPAAV